MGRNWSRRSSSTSRLVLLRSRSNSEGSKAIIVFVPFRQLKKYHEIQGKLVRELEKKLSGRHVVVIAQRTILNKNCRRSKRITGPRPRSRPLAAVHEAILEDLVY